MSVEPAARARGADRRARCSTLQQAADRVFVHHAVAQYAVALVMATRDPAATGLDAVARHVEFGVTPRATLGLVAAARALALLRGRDYVLPRDVARRRQRRARPPLVLSFDAVAEGVDPRQIVDYLVAVVPQPQIAPHDEPLEQAGAGAA